MAGRKSIAITDRQFSVLRLLWEHGPLTVRELMEHLPGGSRLPYTTVLGLLQSMEKAGLVTHSEEGLTYRYEAAVSREQATRTLLGDFVERFFHGSAASLVLGLVDSEQLSPEELKEIERRIADEGQGEPGTAEAARGRTRPRGGIRRRKS